AFATMSESSRPWHVPTMSPDGLQTTSRARSRSHTNRAAAIPDRTWHSYTLEERAGVLELHVLPIVVHVAHVRQGKHRLTTVRLDAKVCMTSESPLFSRYIQTSTRAPVSGITPIRPAVEGNLLPTAVATRIIIKLIAILSRICINSLLVQSGQVKPRGYPIVLFLQFVSLDLSIELVKITELLRRVNNHYFQYSSKRLNIQYPKFSHTVEDYLQPGYRERYLIFS
ncbi:MAG: hypothetical protein R6U40_01980, partial [Desulfobacterales bacterium]